MDDTLVPTLLGMLRVLYWAVFAVTTIDFLRIRDRSRLEIPLIFAFAAIIFSAITTQTDPPFPLLDRLAALSLGLHPYLFLRLAQHFERIPAWVDRVVLGLSVISAVLLPFVVEDIPPSIIVLFLAFFIAAETYAGSLFVRGATTAQGVTRWRALLIVIGAGTLGLLIILVGFNGIYPQYQVLLEVPALMLAAVTPLANYFGIAPPRWLRQVWRRAELGRFLGDLPRSTDNDGIERITAYLRASAVRSAGGLQATIARRDRETQLHLLAPFEPHEPADKGEVFEVIPLELDWGSMLALPAGRFGPETAIHPGAVLVLVVPIAIEGWLWGHLLVSLDSAPLFVLDELELLGLMATQAARFYQYERLSEDQQTLIHISHRLGTRSELAELLADLCSQTRAALRVPIAAVTVVNGERPAAAFSARDDLAVGFGMLLDADPNSPVDSGLLSAGPVRVTDDLLAHADLPFHELVAPLGLRTMAVADMIHEERLIGRLKIVTAGALRHFSDDECALLQGIAAQAALAIRSTQLLAAAQKEIREREKVEGALRLVQASLEQKVDERTAELREQSIRDPMTGVYNRRFMQERLEAELKHADAAGSSVGVIMVDIDDFKQFNDTFGHTAGDELLRWAAEALQYRLRKGDIICRFGGDEFILILVGAELGDSIRRAQELWEELRYGIAGRGQRVTLSMGVAAYPPAGDGVKDVVTRADDALYQAKQAGKDRVIAFAVSEA